MGDYQTSVCILLGFIVLQVNTFITKEGKEGRKENEGRKEGSKAIAKEKGGDERRGEERSAAQRSTTEKRQKNPSGNFEMVKKKDNPPHFR